MEFNCNRVILYFDGASRNNPRGPAGCAFVCYEMNGHGNHGQHLHSVRFHLGTNVSSNQAEYSGLLKGLQFVLDSVNCNVLYVRGDSELIINHMNGFYEVRSPGLVPYYEQARELLGKLQCKCHFKSIPREKNAKADGLATRAADGKHHASNVRPLVAGGNSPRSSCLRISNHGLGDLGGQICDVNWAHPACNSLKFRVGM
jgi:ribonuclease HI